MGDYLYKNVNQGVRGQWSLKQDRKGRNLTFDSSNSQTPVQIQLQEENRETPRLEAWWTALKKVTIRPKILMQQQTDLESINIESLNLQYLSEPLLCLDNQRHIVRQSLQQLSLNRRSSKHPTIGMPQECSRASTGARTLEKTQGADEELNARAKIYSVGVP